MGRNGKGMRDCCDSIAAPGAPHIWGCSQAPPMNDREVMVQARLWIAGQPHTRTSTISTASAMVEALTAAIGEPLEGWE